MWVSLRAAFPKQRLQLADDVPTIPPPTVLEKKRATRKERGWQTAEFVAVWSLIAGLLVCPWISAAALTDTGAYEYLTSARVWTLSLALLFTGAIAFHIFLNDNLNQRKPVLRILGSFAGHLAVSLLLMIGLFGVSDLAAGFIKPLPVAGRLTVPRAQLYGWAHAPFEAIAVGNPDLKETYHERLNSEGWRDVEHSRRKTVPRVMLLGDSQLFGSAVPFDQTMGRHLQRTLGDRWEVVAIGISGWGTDQELLFLDHEGWNYSPDVVVLVFTMLNDVMNNMIDHAFLGTAPKPYFTLAGDKLEFHPMPREKKSLFQRLFSHSTISRHFRFWQQTRQLKPEPEALKDEAVIGESFRALGAISAAEDMGNDYAYFAVCKETWGPRLTEAWRLTLRLIQEMDRRCRAHGVRFLLYAYGQAPDGAPVVTGIRRGKTYRFDFGKPFRQLREFCEREGIAYLDEPNDFRVEYARETLRLPLDGHLNAEGSRRTAEFIAGWVEKNISRSQ